jgi:hypothetical protein
MLFGSRKHNHDMRQITENSYLIFQLIGRIGSVFVGDSIRFLNTFNGNIEVFTHFCLCKSPYIIRIFVVTRVCSHEMQAYMKMCPMCVF